MPRSVTFLHSKYFLFCIIPQFVTLQPVFTISRSVSLSLFSKWCCKIATKSRARWYNVSGCKNETELNDWFCFVHDMNIILDGHLTPLSCVLWGWSAQYNRIFDISIFVHYKLAVNKDTHVNQRLGFLLALWLNCSCTTCGKIPMGRSELAKSPFRQCFFLLWWQENNAKQKKRTWAYVPCHQLRQLYWEHGEYAARLAKNHHAPDWRRQRKLPLE